MWTFDIISNCWEEKISTNYNDNWLPLARSGHIAFEFKENMIMFAGIRQLFQEMGDLNIFEITQSRWHQIFDN